MLSNKTTDDEDRLYMAIEVVIDVLLVMVGIDKQAWRKIEEQRFSGWGPLSLPPSFWILRVTDHGSLYHTRQHHVQQDHPPMIKRPGDTCSSLSLLWLLCI